MDPISGADQLVILLRQKLQERARASSKSKAAKHSKVGGEPVGLPSIYTLLSAEGADPGLLRRALVQNLLAEHFGQEMINDAQFQQIVSRVTGLVEEDADASTLVLQVLSDLKAP